MTRKSDWLGALAAAAVVTLFCFVLLWHDPFVFWNDDYQISILPVFADVARSWNEGHLPLLSPYSWICGNLAGEFQYGTFSVFVNAAVVLIWKLPLTFAQQAAALSMAHLCVLAMGGYMLARDYKLEPPFAMIVALVAALNGWMICWGASDWFGALAAFAWLPWAWWGMRRALDVERGRWRWVWPAPFVYLVVTGGFPYTVLMLALVAAWLAAQQIIRSRRSSNIFPLTFGVLLGVGLSAPAWLALFTYVHGSAREAQEASAHWQWRVPIAALPAFFLPNWTVNWTDFSTRLRPHGATELACGLVPPVALLAGLVRFPRELLRKIWPELVLLAVVLIATMLPTAGVFRWSFRWLPLLHVLLALCAAVALQMLADRAKLKLAIVIAAVGLAFLAALMAATQAGGAHLAGVIISTAALVLSWWVASYFVRARINLWIPAVVTALALSLTYLIIPPNCGVPRYNFTHDLLEPDPLSADRLYLSFYPQPEDYYRVDKHPAPVGETVRPGSSSMWGGVRLINGYSPIRPAGVARLLFSGIHGELDYGTTELALRSHAGPDGEMAKLGIDGVIVAREFNVSPQPATEWQPVQSSPEGTVYHRTGAPIPAARAFWDADLTQSDDIGTVKIVTSSRNEIVVEYAGDPEDELPIFVAFSRPYFAGYVATDGSDALEVTAYRGLIPIIELPAGFTGRVTLSYRPTWLIYGGAAAIGCAVVWLAGLVATIVARAKRAA